MKIKVVNVKQNCEWVTMLKLGNIYIPCGSEFSGTEIIEGEKVCRVIKVKLGQFHIYIPEVE